MIPTSGQLCAAGNMTRAALVSKPAESLPRGAGETIALSARAWVVRGVSPWCMGCLTMGCTRTGEPHRKPT